MDDDQAELAVKVISYAGMIFCGLVGLAGIIFIILGVAFPNADSTFLSSIANTDAYDVGVLVVTIIFIIIWLLSIVSGIVHYYLLNRKEWARIAIITFYFVAILAWLPIYLISIGFLVWYFPTALLHVIVGTIMIAYYAVASCMLLFIPDIRELFT